MPSLNYQYGGIEPRHLVDGSQGKLFGEDALGVLKKVEVDAGQLPS